MNIESAVVKPVNVPAPGTKLTSRLETTTATPTHPPQSLHVTTLTQNTITHTDGYTEREREREREREGGYVGRG